MARKSSKQAILEAAMRVIQRNGLSATTIEAVAAEAGLSKGGLFYHFASKRELLITLIEHYNQHFLEMREKIMATMPDDPNRLVKATIIANRSHPATKVRSSMSNLVALLDDQDARRVICDLKKKIFQELSAESGEPEKIALIMLVLDGFWVMDMFNADAMDEEFQKRILDELLRIVDRLGVPAEAAAQEGGS